MIAAFAESLRCGDAPTGLTSWNGSDPAQRFAVYRNNVAVSLREALAAKFPLIAQLLGADYFAALANEYRAAHPPLAPRLALYGDAFGAFIESFQPLRAWPFLADVARFETAWLEAYHAEDVAPLQPSAFAMRDDLADMRPRLHPSLRLLASRFAIVGLAERLSTDQTLDDFDVDRPQTALIVRPHMDVAVFALPADEAEFVARLMNGASVAEAAAAALSVSSAFDPGDAFRNLFKRELIVTLWPGE